MKQKQRMDKPNLVVIMADQLRYDAMGAHGNPDILTPNLDRLAGESCDFGSYFTNAPVCVPSRCSLLTGKYLHSHGVRENHTVLESGREIHLFRALKQAGYAISYSGKNHVLMEEEFRNFDRVILEEQGLLTDIEQQCHAFQKEIEKQVGSHGYQCARFHEFGKEATGAWKYTTHGLQFMEELSREEQPFCTFISLVEPHYPHVAPKEIWDLYDPEQLKVPEVMDGELAGKAARYKIKQQAQHADQASLAEKRNYLQAYYSLVTLVDMQIGRVVEQLDALGIRENTLLVVTTDHGDFNFQHNLYKKDLVLTDCLLHVPLLLHWKNTIQPAFVREALVEQVDVLPTLLAQLGLDCPRGVQGTSVAELVLSENASAGTHKEAVFAEINPPWLFNRFGSYEEMKAFWKQRGVMDPPFNVPGDYTKSIRTRDYRYVWYGNGEEELYDLIADPGETCNLAARESLQGIKMDLKVRLLEWHAHTENPLDPALVWQLGQTYDKWLGATGGNRVRHLPYWADEAYLAWVDTR